LLFLCVQAVVGMHDHVEQSQSIRHGICVTDLIGHVTLSA